MNRISPQPVATDVVALGDDGEKASQNSALNLEDLLRVWRLRRRIILGTLLIVVALTTAVVFLVTPLYTADAVVMLNQQKNSVEDVNSVLSDLPTDQVSIQNQVEILTSRALVSRVIRSLSLEHDAELNKEFLPQWLTTILSYAKPSTWFGGVSLLSPAEQAAADHDRLVDRFLKRTSVDPVGLSTAIEVGFESEDPSKAVRIANSIADEYVEDQLNTRFEATQKATKWLSDRINQLAQQVQAADSGVQQYKAANNLTETTEGTSLVDQQLATVNSQLVAAKSDLAQKQAMYGRVASLERGGHSADVSQVVQSPLIAQLRGQETDLIRQEAQLKSKYGPNHPKLIDLQSQTTNVQQKINEEVGHVVQTVANDAAVSAAQVRSLQQSLSRLEGQETVQNKAEIQLKALESRATSARSMYEAFLARLKETQGQEGILAPDARVLSPASFPSSPTFPNKPIILGVAVPAGFLLGLMIAFMAERLDSGFRSSKQAEEYLGLPVLATVPEVSSLGKSEGPADQIVAKPMSQFTEAIRGLELGLKLSNVDRAPQVIVVTSSGPEEGKTVLAVSLARLAAKTGGRAIIVDADLRHPSIIKVFGLKPAKRGILEVVAGQATLEECLLQDPASDLKILPCAQKPKNPHDLLSSNAMRDLLMRLRSQFDTIIVDSAPVLPVHDTKLLAPLADTFLFVVRWEKTARPSVANSLRALSSVKASIAGLALTRADPHRMRYYAYGNQSYKYYDKYYSE